jgi:hypothetical protein
MWPRFPKVCKQCREGGAGFSLREKNSFEINDLQRSFLEGLLAHGGSRTLS